MTPRRLSLQFFLILSAVLAGCDCAQKDFSWELSDSTSTPLIPTDRAKLPLDWVRSGIVWSDDEMLFAGNLKEGPWRSLIVRIENGKPIPWEFPNKERDPVLLTVGTQTWALTTGIHLYRSHDRGRTWSEHEKIGETGDQEPSACVLLNGNIILANENGGDQRVIKVRSYGDGNWGSPIQPYPSDGLRNHEDACILQTPTGRILLVFEDETLPPKGWEGETESQIVLLRSDNEGKTWEAEQMPLASGTNVDNDGPKLIVSGCQVLCLWKRTDLSNNSSELACVVSNDDGLTWHQIESVAPGYANVGTGRYGNRQFITYFAPEAPTPRQAFWLVHKETD